MQEFQNDETAYIYWVADNPDGFVLNLRKNADASYVVLHRATCKTISSTKPEPGAYTERGYRKACSDTLDDLHDAARSEGRRDGSFSKVCSLCMPDGLPRRARRTATPIKIETGKPETAKAEPGAIAAKSARPNFDVKLGKAYWSQGFFNVGVSHERYFGRHASAIEIFLGPGSSFITGHVNRTANTNQTPRVMGGALMKTWIQRNSRLGRSIRVEVLAQDKIRLTS